MKCFGSGLECEFNGFLCERRATLQRCVCEITEIVCMDILYVSAGLCGYSLRLAVVDSSSLTCEIDPCQSVCATDDQSAERQGN